MAQNVGGYKDYQFAALFQAHADDVKQVKGTELNNLISCSRDETVKIWGSALYSQNATNLLATLTASPPCAVNSLEFTEHREHAYVFAGRKDGSIVVYRDNDTRAFLVLKGHTMNVCCLHINSRYSFLVSGGWDHNAVIWSLDSICNGRDSDCLMLEGHSNSVWAIDSANDVADTVFTGSADRTIRMWKGNTLTRTFTGHSDVVRTIRYLGDGLFFSGCNDGKIRTFKDDTETPFVVTPTAAAQFIYSMCLFSTDSCKLLAVSMESGVTEIFIVLPETNALVPASSLQIPDSTAWSVTSMPNGDIVIGAGNGIIYVFTASDERVAAPELALTFAESVSIYLAAIAEKNDEGKEVTIKVALDDGPPRYDLTYVKGTDPADAAAKFIAKHSLPSFYLTEIIQFIKSNVPAAAAYEKNQVVNEAVSTLKKARKSEYKFPVKLDDGRDVVLVYNTGDTPEFAAQRFVEEHNLPISKIKPIANLLRTQIPDLVGFGSGNVDPLTGGNAYATTQAPTPSGAAGGYVDPLTGGGRYVPGTPNAAVPTVSLPIDRLRPRGILVPVKEPVIFGSEGASAKAIERLRAINAAQDPEMLLSEDEVRALEAIMADPAKANGQIFIDALTKAMQWEIDNLVPVLDIFRLALLNSGLNTHFCSVQGIRTLERLGDLAISHPSPAIAICVTRALANAASHPAGQRLLLRDITMLVDIALKKAVSEKPSLQASSLAILTNLAFILLKNTEVDKVAELGPREDALRAIFASLESGSFNLDSLGEPALVRFLQAVATLLWGDSAVIRLAKSRNILPFINQVKDKVADEQGKALARDIVEMLYAV